MGDDMQKDIGRHEAQIEALKADMMELKGDVKTILATLSEARGGWRTLMMVAGVSGTLGAITTKLVHAIGWVPK